MRKIILPAFAVLAVAMSMEAEVTVNFPAGVSGEYEVESMLVTDMVKPRAERPIADLQALVPSEGITRFNTLQGGAAQSVIYTSEREGIPVYTMPGETLMVDIASMEPLVYTVSGSQLMEEISHLDSLGNEIKREYFSIARSENPDETRMAQLAARYDLIFADYISDHPESPAVIYALLQLDGQGYLDMYEKVAAVNVGNPLYPLAVNKKNRVEKSIEAEKRMEALQSDHVDAPAFTLKNPEGKDVSLSEFKGKWVILDFWGSWCPWCIKGFPALKEAYAKYAGKLEIIGVDCRDSEQSWRAALKRYDLPWVQVYNGEPGADRLYDEYGVQGFPTKVIVSPAGKIVNITVGEDPTFFSKLSELMSGE
ncbi:MAG: TlpA family protein disulfide reductase [Muribaculaceae bacterium]|nr:TlpA family protein disulfide reductase [Muribaculaceae bacterium]